MFIGEASDVVLRVRLEIEEPSPSEPCERVAELTTYSKIGPLSEIKIRTDAIYGFTRVVDIGFTSD